MAKEQDKQEILRQGQSTEFWRLILEVLDQNVENLRAQQDSEDFKELSNKRKSYVDKNQSEEKDSYILPDFVAFFLVKKPVQNKLKHSAAV